MAVTAIEWTDETWNPVTGCSRVSPGCDNCYMFSLYPRLTAMNVPGYQDGPGIVRLLPERLEYERSPLRWQRPRRIFVNSMSDLFHNDIPYEFISRVFDVMRQASQHQFQVLTKRPGIAAHWWETVTSAGEFPDGWPQNVLLGVSVELQKYAPRIKVLGRIPDAVKFVSAEPLLGHLDLSGYLDAGMVHWVIVGGESGRKARPMELEWADSLREQCEQTKVPFFLKQLGGRSDKRGGEKATLNGRRYLEMPEFAVQEP